MPTIGIAIVTYNRSARLGKVIEQVRKHTIAPYELIVADDGSTDDTRDIAAAAGVRLVSGENRGVCWNKNRGLFALASLGCDPILLLEDDIYPMVNGWENEWIEATAKWHHLSYAHPKIAPQIIEGSGTADDPFVNQKSTAQCTSISLEALRDVGFLDTRFKGYGVGHAEWTSRLKARKFGMKWVILEHGHRARANLYITGGLQHDDAVSFRDKASVQRNKELFEKIKSEEGYRTQTGQLPPWSSDEEKEIFLHEQSHVGVREIFI